MLCGQTIEKDKILQNSNLLIEELINLPLQLNANANDNAIENNLSEDTNQQNKILVSNIDHETRMKIIDNFIKTSNFLSSSNSINSRISLIEENTKLINFLLKFPVKFIDCDTLNDLNSSIKKKIDKGDFFIIIIK